MNRVVPNWHVLAVLLPKPRHALLLPLAAVTHCRGCCPAPFVTRAVFSACTLRHPSLASPPLAVQERALLYAAVVVGDTVLVGQYTERLGRVAVGLISTKAAEIRWGRQPSRGLSASH